MWFSFSDLNLCLLSTTFPTILQMSEIAILTRKKKKGDFDISMTYTT